MKLSEAIRKGAAMTPPTRGELWERIGGKVCTCALGAAIAGESGNLETLRSACALDFARMIWPELDYRFGRCDFEYPGEVLVGGERPKHLANIILTLNDDDGWTREQIADWAEGQGL